MGTQCWKLLKSWSHGKMEKKETENIGKLRTIIKLVLRLSQKEMVENIKG